MAPWKIPPLPCTLNGFPIWVEQVEDEWSRALVEHTYPSRDGADLEDLGADSQRTNLSAFVFGPGWKATLESIRDSLSLLPTHVLVHPQWGTLTGRVRRFSVTHRDDEHDCARIRIDFVTGTVTAWSFAVSTSVASAAAGVSTAAAGVSAASAGL